MHTTSRLLTLATQPQLTFADCAQGRVHRLVANAQDCAPMTWVEVLAAFLVAHMVGDYLLQTDWQARHKAGGLGGDRVAFRALTAHVATYTLAFVPVCVWIGDERGAGWAALTAALVALPHLVVDDARIVRLYLREVKGAESFDRGLAATVDQAFHIVSLCVVALLVGAA